MYLCTFSRNYVRVFILVLFLTIAYNVKVIIRSVRCYLTITEHSVFLLFHSYMLVCEHKIPIMCTHFMHRLNRYNACANKTKQVEPLGDTLN